MNPRTSRPPRAFTRVRTLQCKAHDIAPLKPWSKLPQSEKRFWIRVQKAVDAMDAVPWNESSNLIRAKDAGKIT